jgi:hypothetical protein
MEGRNKVSVLKLKASRNLLGGAKTKKAYLCCGAVLYVYRMSTCKSIGVRMLDGKLQKQYITLCSL